VEEFRHQQKLLNSRSIITAPGELLRVNLLILRVTLQTVRGAVLTVLPVLITTAEVAQIPVRLLAVLPAVVLLTVVAEEQPGAVPLQAQVPMADHGEQISYKKLSAYD
jgi:hypothetical protein